MRESDWSSDVCSSDLLAVRLAYAFTLRGTVSIRAEPTFERLRYLFGGDRPSQTAHMTMSPGRIHGRRLEFQQPKSGIPRATPPRLAPRFPSLPPILYIDYRNPILSCSKAPWGLSVLSRVTDVYKRQALNGLGAERLLNPLKLRMPDNHNREPDSVR